MRSFLILALAITTVTTPALAQHVPGSIGNGGRLPETMSPGALPPPPTIVAPSMPAAQPSASYGGRYPNTESLSRDRIQSEGYRVKSINRQNDGSWKADVSRDPVPTRPKGVPSKVTVYPDGRIVEER
ncbi:MAG TPA: hypothetical protein VFF19_32395 [Reyranella sp.]|jgi:hypothetical protein|nr:hypothetical protein [Reyranella sp.]